MKIFPKESEIKFINWNNRQDPVWELVTWELGCCAVSQSHVHPAARGMAAALAGIPGVLSELAP